MKYKIQFILVLLSFLFIQFIPNTSYSQFFKSWNSSYIISDSAVCIGTALGKFNTAVTGKVKNPVSGSDVHTVFYNLWTGQPVRTVIYSTSENEEPVDIKSSYNQDMFYVLCKRSDSSGKSSLFIIKYNGFGDQIWTSEYNGPVNEEQFPVSIGLVHNFFGNKFLYTTSKSYSKGDSTCKILTQKIDSSGNYLWSSYYTDTTLAGSTNDVPVNIELSEDNLNTIVAGITTDSAGISQAMILKYDSSGNVLWKQNWGTSVPRNNFVTCMDLKNNNFAVGGIIQMGSTFDYFILKYDMNGNLLWSQTYDGPGNGNDYMSDIGIDNSGSVVVTGSIYIDSVNKSDYGIVKYLSTGNFQWANSFNGPASGNDSAVCMVIDNFNCIFVTGKTLDTTGYYCFGSKLYNQNGSTHWTRYFRSPALTGDNIPVGVSKQQFTNSFSLTGNTFGDTLNSFTTLFYAGIIDGIEDNNSLNAGSYKLNQNYPNPFNPKTKINYELHVTSGEFVSLKIFNVLGNEVATIVNEKQNRGRYSVEFDGSNFSSGVYFYKLTYSDISTTMKMILLK